MKKSLVLLALTGATLAAIAHDPSFASAVSSPAAAPAAIAPAASAAASPAAAPAAPAPAAATVATNTPGAAARQAPPADITLDAATRQQVIEQLIKHFNANYIFPDVALKAEKAIREKAKKKGYDGINQAPLLATVLTSDLREVTHDKHVTVRYSVNPLPPQTRVEDTPSPEELERQRKFGEQVNYGFHKVERLDGNIGYLDLDGFFTAGMAGETAAAAWRMLAGTQALIIDLRHNGGGDPAMVALMCSYLFGDEPVHLNDLKWREGNQTREWWTLPYVPGQRYLNRDVYVLISGRTFSGAEEFTYNVKNLKRATIIGETTGGGANPGGMQPLTEHFGVFIPSGRAESPITHTNWEGTGVTPDVEVRPELALETARVMALKKLGDANLEPRAAFEIKEALADAQRELEAARTKLPPLAEPALKGNTTFTLKGFSGARKVALSGSFSAADDSPFLCARQGDAWTCRVDLKPGRYTYNFLVDSRPTLDPGNANLEQDGPGFRSVIEVK